MKPVACTLLCLGFLPLVCGLSIPAQTESPVDAVTVKEDAVYSIRGGQLELLTDNLKLPFDIEVNTNCTFKVANGPDRKLEAGQVLRRDGWLLNPDGSSWPVYDYVAMKQGKVIVMRDGEAETLTKPVVFADKLKINPDGSCVYPNGSVARLVDGQLFRLNGASVPSKDTVTLKEGRVVVQKSGKLISLKSPQIMGMNDGTRIRWDGTLISPDGSMTHLQEGQTVLVDGPVSAH